MDTIEPFVTEQLSAWEVPGCAAVAVRDGKIALVGGWGLRDREGNLPVTEDTLFAIGSVTKAFTAAAVGILVDEGLVEWDRPLRDYLPELRLHDGALTERLTAVDLLSHRSGLPRHDVTWLAHPDWSRSDLVHRLRFLPFSRDLRQEFQYCNFGYLVAGYLVEVIAGISWEEFVGSRLLTPLGMGRTNLSAGDMGADPDHATAYERREGGVVPVQQRAITALAPAGGINSSARDMARWLLAQLGGGGVGGTAVVSAANVARQQTPHMLMPENLTFPEATRYAYGLGWVIGRYRDHRLVEHDGGIDGFLTECMLLPDHGIGVAVMTNSSSGAMAPLVAYRVLDELLGLEPIDWFARFKPRFDAALTGSREARSARPVVAGAKLPRPPEAYAGRYEHPGYGVLTVTLQDGHLSPSFGTMDLSLAHRHYETFDLEWHELGDQPHLFPLMYLSDPDGDIVALTVRLEPSVEALRFDRLPKLPSPEILPALCGTYTMGPVNLVVALQGQPKLTIAVQGATPLELIPARGLRFGVKGQPRLTAEFHLDETGAVTRLVVQPLGIFVPEG